MSEQLARFDLIKRLYPRNRKLNEIILILLFMQIMRLFVYCELSNLHPCRELG